MSLDSTDYLISALAELEYHAKKTLKEARFHQRKARRGFYVDREWHSDQAIVLEEKARADLAEIQRILANPNLNR